MIKVILELTDLGQNFGLVVRKLDHGSPEMVISIDSIRDDG